MDPSVFNFQPADFARLMTVMNDKARADAMMKYTNTPTSGTISVDVEPISFSMNVTAVGNFDTLKNKLLLYGGLAATNPTLFAKITAATNVVFMGYISASQPGEFNFSYYNEAGLRNYSVLLLTIQGVAATQLVFTNYFYNAPSGWVNLCGSLLLYKA